MEQPVEYMGNACPQRVGGLPHVTVAFDLKCIYCNARVSRIPPRGIPEGVTEASVTPPEPVIEDALAEPRAITGRGPQGSVWRPGRSPRGDGALSADDKSRLVFYVEHLRGHNR